MTEDMHKLIDYIDQKTAEYSRMCRSGKDQIYSLGAVDALVSIRKFIILELSKYNK